jgi:hypothetical protein
LDVGERHVGDADRELGDQGEEVVGELSGSVEGGGADFDRAVRWGKKAVRT